jgi:hypothetical protein
MREVAVIMTSSPLYRLQQAAEKLTLYTKCRWNLPYGAHVNRFRMLKKTVQQSVRRESLNVKGFGGKALGNPTFHLSRFLRTPLGERRVSARRGWAGEKSDFFSILLAPADSSTTESSRTGTRSPCAGVPTGGSTGARIAAAAHHCPTSHPATL